MKIGYEVMDIGVNTEDSVNYLDIARELAEQVRLGKFDRGIPHLRDGDRDGDRRQ